MEIGDREQFDWVEFWYQNISKVDSFISQLNGRLEGERTETVSKTIGGRGTLGVEIGGILAALGLAKGKAEGEIHGDYGKILEITSSLSSDNKVLLMLSFLQQQNELTPIELFEVDPAGVRRTRTRFQLLMGGFEYVEGDAGARELRSALSSESGPVVRVPLLTQHYLPSQTINAVAGGDVFAHHVFCTFMPQAGWMLASPIAIWFPIVDPETLEMSWWTGRRTAGLDAQGLPAPG